jgi:uncharacterized cupin superfamily protein
MNTYYATISSNQDFKGNPGYGCVEIHAENEGQARELIHAATNGRWAFMYDDLEKVHPLDRTILGELQ